MAIKLQHKHDPTVVYYRFWGLSDAEIPYGFFYTGDEHIYIQAGLSKWEKEITYIHEAQHRKCQKTKCFCDTQVSPFWTEYHAYRAEFLAVYESQHPQLSAAYIGLMVKGLKTQNLFRKDHKTERQVLRKLMKWSKFQEFLDNWDILDLLQRALEGR